MTVATVSSVASAPVLVSSAFGSGGGVQTVPHIEPPATAVAAANGREYITTFDVVAPVASSVVWGGRGGSKGSSLSNDSGSNAEQAHHEVPRHSKWRGRATEGGSLAPPHNAAGYDSDDAIDSDAGLIAWDSPAEAAAFYAQLEREAVLARLAAWKKRQQQK